MDDILINVLINCKKTLTYNSSPKYSGQLHFKNKVFLGYFFIYSKYLFG